MIYFCESKCESNYIFLKYYIQLIKQKFWLGNQKIVTGGVLNVNTLGPREIDENNQILTLTKHTLGWQGQPVVQRYNVGFATGQSGFNSRQDANNFSLAWVLCLPGSSPGQIHRNQKQPRACQGRKFLEMLWF